MHNQFFVLKKLLVNGLTLSRIPISILFNFSLFYEKNKLFICSLLFLIIALTDILDGKLARHYKVTSKFGALLDAGTDFFFIFSASFLLYTQMLLPIGLIINKKLNLNKTLFFDKIGRFVAVILYLLPLFALILHTYLHRNISNLIIFYTVLLITGLSAVSIYRRTLKLIHVNADG